ncbi:hypothetical protein LINPERPRIM_LOCUS25298 [Linum perenne]
MLSYLGLMTPLGTEVRLS